MQSGLKRFLLVGIALLINLTFTVTAQDEPSPLLSAFSQIPYTAQALGNWGERVMDTGFIYYTDIDAIVEAYPEMERVSLRDVPKDQLTDAQAGWTTMLLNEMQLSSDFGTAMLQLDTPPALGVDLFTAGKVVSYGTPPIAPLLILGDWENEVIRSSLSETGYTAAADVSGVELWCAAAGCVAGSQPDPTLVNNANPFGGRSGRLSPTVLGEGYVWGAALDDLATLPLVLKTDETTLTLADQPRYQAAVEALFVDGTVLQAMVLDGGMLLYANSVLAPDGSFSAQTFAPNTSLPDPSAEQVAYDALLAGRAGYQLMVWGDVVTDDAQVFRAVMVYPDVESAEQVAQTILPALEFAKTRPSIRTKQLMDEMFSDRRIDSVTTRVVEAGGYGVLVMDVSTPKVTLEQYLQLSQITLTPQDLGVTRPGTLYRLFTQALYSNDYPVFGWFTGAAPSEAFILEMVELGVLGEEAQQALEEFNAGQGQ